MTLNSEKKFKAKTPYIKKAAYDVVMYSPRLAENSVATIKKTFNEGTLKQKEQLIKMLEMASAIAMSHAKNFKRYTKVQREKFFEVAVMYKALRRDLRYELKSM